MSEEARSLCGRERRPMSDNGSLRRNKWVQQRRESQASRRVSVQDRLRPLGGTDQLQSSPGRFAARLIRQIQFTVKLPPRIAELASQLRHAAWRQQESLRDFAGGVPLGQR